MSIREATIEDKKAWNEFVEANSSASFPQLWEWGEMQSSLTFPHWRLIVESEDIIKAVALVVKRDLPFNLSWLYIPRGPVVKGRDAFLKLEEKLVELATQEKAMFVRLDPASTQKDFLNERWQKANREVQPQHTLVTNLEQSEDELLQHMHSKTRYNIRLAKRKGVQIRFSQNTKDLDQFLELTKAVSSRSDFTFHPTQYYQVMCEVLMPAGKLEIALAEYQGTTLAAHLIVKNGDTVVYAHGASSSEHRNVMAPYLLQWETIKKAKAEGFTYYDWFGIAPERAGTEHSWAGITKFKKGFGGEAVSYIGAYDMVKRPVWYRLYHIVRTIYSYR